MRSLDALNGIAIRVTSLCRNKLNFVVYFGVVVYYCVNIHNRLIIAQQYFFRKAERGMRRYREEPSSEP